MRNVRLDICYDGSRYKGWQRLGTGQNSIQEKLEVTLSRILGEPIEISGSGRTDAGTHAKGQVANFHCNSQMPDDQLLLELRRYLPEDIGIYSCRSVSQRFHARLNAKTKTYLYRVWNSDTPCVFERKFVHIDPRAVDVALMAKAAEDFVGTHDFAAFCAHKSNKSTQRHIHSFRVEQKGNEIHFTVTGNGFLHHMVRIMVGTLLEIGRGERPADDISGLYSKKRENAGSLVPACGLCLMEVTY